MLGLRKRMVAPTLHPADFFTRQTLTEYVFAHQFLGRSVHHGLSLNLWPEVAEHFHRALISDVRARRVGQPAVAVHDHVRHAVASEQRRRRRASRPCTHDQNVGFDIRHYSKPSIFGPTSLRRTGNKCRSARAEIRPHSPFGANSITAMAIRPSVIRYQLP